MFKTNLDGGIKMFRTNFKRIMTSILVCAMILGTLLSVGDVIASAAPVRSVNVENANGTGDTTVSVVTLNNIMMANANDLANALRNYTTVAANQATSTVAAGTMEISYGSLRLFLGAGSRQAYLTEGVGTATPATRLITLRTPPVMRTVAGASVLFVPFADTMRALGISVGRAGARIREVPRRSDFTWGANARLTGQAAVSMLAKGATFQEELNDSWFGAYDTISAGTDSFLYTRPSLTPIDGGTSGSGFGRRIVRARAVVFGGTDDPIPATDLDAAHYVLIPAAMGAVTVITNIYGMTTPINLTADIVADIYRGVITRWDDARILRINTRDAATLRNLGANVAIIPGARQDSSGTTAIFTTWMNSAAPTNWPTAGHSRVIDTTSGLPANSATRIVEPTGSGGGALRDFVNAGSANIGFVVLADARGIPSPNYEIARIRNSSGIFVAPTVQSTMAAGLLHTNLLTHPVNSAHPGAYPIVGLTWYMVERDVTVAKSDFAVPRRAGEPSITSIYDGAVTMAAGPASGDAVSTPIVRPAITDPAALAARDARIRVFRDFIDWAIVRGFGDGRAIADHYAPLSPNMKRQVPGLLNQIVR